MDLLLLFTSISQQMKANSRKMKVFERKTLIILHRVLIGMYTEGFNFTIFCIGFMGMAFVMAKYVFVRNGLEYLNFMLIICPLAHYIMRSLKKKEKLKDEKMRRELTEEIEKLKSEDH